MRSSKSLAVRLTDIWIECENEMLKMKSHINYLKQYLNVMEILDKHLNDCNESLITIIEKCDIDYKTNNDIITDINDIKIHEKEVQKCKLKLSEINENNKENCDFSDENVMKIINNFRKYGSNKSINTLNKEMERKTNKYPINTYNETNEEVLETYMNEKISDSKHINTEISFSNNKSGFTKSNKSVAKKSDIMTKLSDNSNDNESNDDIYSPEETDVSDSEWDSKKEMRKTRKGKLGRPSKRELNADFIKSRRQICVDTIALPFKFGTDFICKEPNCDLITKNKRVFYEHYRQHEKQNGTYRRKRGKSLYAINCDRIVISDTDSDSEKANVDKHNDQNQSQTNSKISQKSLFEKILEYKINNEFVCKECEFKVENEHIFVEHYLNHKRLKGKLVFDSERPYSCSWPGCEKKFKRSGHLYTHILRHKNIRKYSCDWPGCGYRVNDRNPYLTHMRSHTKEKPFSCDWPGCEYRCNAKWSLTAHKRKHSGEKPYECLWPNCAYKCSQPGTLILHKRKHTGEKPYVCKEDNCEKGFSSLAGIRLHKQMHNRRERNKSKIVILKP